MTPHEKMVEEMRPFSEYAKDPDPRVRLILTSEATFHMCMTALQKAGIKKEEVDLKKVEREKPEAVKFGTNHRLPIGLVVCYDAQDKPFRLYTTLKLKDGNARTKSS